MKLITITSELIFIFALLFLSCQEKNPEILFRTEYGDIKAELFAGKAPITVSNFLRYVKEDRLKDAVFYRVVRMDNQPNDSIKIEVVQGGLFDENHPQLLPPIPHENTSVTNISHLDGTLSMARYGPGTATCEFAIMVGDQPELDFGGKRNPDGQGFAAFGRVTSGMDVVRRIQVSPSVDQYLRPFIKINEVVLLP